MDRYCYVIENQSDFPNRLNRWTTIHPIIVSSVQDMVQKVIRRVGSDVLANLYIAGHGMPCYQSVGFDPERTDTSGLQAIFYDEALHRLCGPAERYLVLLRPLFRRTSIVTLGGCNVAEGTGGREFLMYLAKMWGGITVQGSTAIQDATPGMEGDVIRCTPSRCQTLSSNWWGTPGGGWIN